MIFKERKIKQNVKSISNCVIFMFSAHLTSCNAKTTLKSCFLILRLIPFFPKIFWMDLFLPINVFQLFLPNQISYSKLVTEFQLSPKFFLTKAGCVLVSTKKWYKQWKYAKNIKHKTGIYSWRQHSQACQRVFFTVRFMTDLENPVLRDNPDNIVFHISTNDVPKH